MFKFKRIPLYDLQSTLNLKVKGAAYQVHSEQRLILNLWITQLVFTWVKDKSHPFLADNEINNFGNWLISSDATSRPKT